MAMRAVAKQDITMSATKRMFALVTASQIASASAASFFCRFT